MLKYLHRICNKNNIKFGAIFYSYYNPLEGWDISWRDNNYNNCVTLEGDIALETIQRLKK